MKKSDVYKFALAAAVEKLAREKLYPQYNHDVVYDLVSGLCERIDLELLQERREEATHE